MKNILIVEDESIVAIEIKSYINKLGFNVIDICSNSDDVFLILSKLSIDIILMDICIKGKLDGVELATIIKKRYPNIKIIFLTAHLDDYNVDRAIKIDPVSYLSKPFNREELRVALKIANSKLDNSNSMQYNSEHIVLDFEYSYDSKNSALYYYNEPISLTKKENELLELFIEHKNSILEFYTIENIIWADKEVNINTIRTLVKRLREKLKYKFIENIPSRGYRMNLEIP